MSSWCLFLRGKTLYSFCKKDPFYYMYFHFKTAKFVSTQYRRFRQLIWSINSAVQTKSLIKSPWHVMRSLQEKHYLSCLNGTIVVTYILLKQPWVYNMQLLGGMSSNVKWENNAASFHPYCVLDSHEFPCDALHDLVPFMRF